MTVWGNDAQVPTSYSHISQLVWDVFEYLAGGYDISFQLLQLCQGCNTAADYEAKFHTLAAQSSWNDPALEVVFQEGLNPTL